MGRADGRATTAGMRVRRAAAVLLATVAGVLAAVPVGEAYLRMFRPVDIRVKGDRIVLPVNRRYVIRNDGIPKLDRVIVHRKNRLGFRGEDPPPDFGARLSVVAVGGSTTESFYVSEGKTWTDRLGERLRNDFPRLWINNAGLDGHSTYGHLVLLREYIAPLRPDVVLFLLGCNDQAKDGMAGAEAECIRTGISMASAKDLMKSLAGYSDVVAVLNNKYRLVRERFKGVPRGNVDLSSCPYAEAGEDRRASVLRTHRARYLSPFRARVTRLVTLARAGGIAPVLITSPALYGRGIDGPTGKDLARIRMGEGDGRLAWEVLELYNDVIREVGRVRGVPVIDLAREMPKSSEYYYDFNHFSNLGSDVAADILSRHLRRILADRFPGAQRVRKAA